MSMKGQHSSYFKEFEGPIHNIENEMKSLMRINVGKFNTFQDDFSLHKFMTSALSTLDSDIDIIFDILKHAHGNLGRKTLLCKDTSFAYIMTMVSFATWMYRIAAQLDHAVRPAHGRSSRYLCKNATKKSLNIIIFRIRFFIEDWNSDAIKVEHIRGELCSCRHGYMPHNGGNISSLLDSLPDAKMTPTQNAEKLVTITMSQEDKRKIGTILKIRNIDPSVEIAEILKPFSNEDLLLLVDLVKFDNMKFATQYDNQERCTKRPNQNPKPLIRPKQQGLCQVHMCCTVLLQN